MEETLQHGTISNKCTKSMTPLNELKVTIALEPKLEGYTHITFDKVVDMYSAKARVHVLVWEQFSLSLCVITFKTREMIRMYRCII